jgi:hypothetical protein
MLKHTWKRLLILKVTIKRLPLLKHDYKRLPMLNDNSKRLLMLKYACKRLPMLKDNSKRLLLLNHNLKETSNAQALQARYFYLYTNKQNYSYTRYTMVV